MALAVALAGLIGGCGGPSNREVAEAVRRHCKSSGVLSSLIKPPPGRYVPLRTYDLVTFEEARVVKRGRRYTSSVGRRVWPVRVHVAGTALAVHARVTDRTSLGVLGGVVGVTDLQRAKLPFEGDADFALWWEPPNKARVDPEPGRWEAGYAE
jgi:hypothetical protein